MSLQLVERGLERSGLPLEPCAWPFRSRLTVKLRGRAPRPARRRGRTISSSARGAQPQAPHGPLQRLLEDAFIEGAVRARTPEPKPKSTARPVSRRPQTQGTAATNRSHMRRGHTRARKLPARARGVFERREPSDSLLGSGFHSEHYPLDLPSLQIFGPLADSNALVQRRRAAQSAGTGC